MSYRALFAADIHAGNQLPWAVKDPVTLITDRCQDIMAVLSQMSGYCLENEIQDIWIVGDLIDKRLVDAVTLKLVTEELMAIQQLELSDGRRLRVFLIPGNHEAGDAACKHFTLDAFSSMGFWVAGVTDTVAGEQLSYIEPVDGFEVVCMPFLPAARAQQLLEGSTFHAPSLLLIHQTIKGGMVGGWTSPDGLEPPMLENVAAQVFSGHFHNPQSVTERTHYLGAPVQHTFADAGDVRGFWDVTWGGPKRLERRKIPVHGAPTFHELIWTGGKPPNPVNIGANDYVTIKVSGLSTEVNKQWITAEQWAGELKTERNLRMCRLVQAITAGPNKARISLDGERPTWDTVLSKYLDAADCTGLNRQTLEQLGKELLADADK